MRLTDPDALRGEPRDDCQSASRAASWRGTGARAAASGRPADELWRVRPVRPAAAGIRTAARLRAAAAARVRAVTGARRPPGIRSTTGLRTPTGLRRAAGLWGAAGLRGATGLRGVAGLRGAAGLPDRIRAAVAQPLRTASPRRCYLLRPRAPEAG